MPNSTGDTVPCYFCALGHTRTDTLRNHCKVKHPSGPDVIAAGKNVCSYTFHYLNGHTDRVWATTRNGESPTNVGHCFLCHTFFAKGAYKTIEEATGGHSCSSLVGRTRAKRTVVTTPAATPTATAKIEPSIVITEKLLLDKYRQHGKTLEYHYTDDCSVDVAKSVDLLFEKAFAAPTLHKQNLQFAKDLTALHASSSNVADSMDAPSILSVLKKDRGLTAFVTAQETLKIQAAAEPMEDDDEIVPYDPFDVIKQFAMDAKARYTEQKRYAATDELKEAKISQLESELTDVRTRDIQQTRQLVAYHKDCSALEERCRHQDAEIKRLQSLLATLPTAPEVSS